MYPVAYQQHSYSLEDIFILRVDLPKVYNTFSRVEDAFISVEGLLWIFFSFNFTIIPKPDGINGWDNFDGLSKGNFLS